MALRQNPRVLLSRSSEGIMPYPIRADDLANTVLGDSTMLRGGGTLYQSRDADHAVQTPEIERSRVFEGTCASTGSIVPTLSPYPTLWTHHKTIHFQDVFRQDCDA